MGDPNRVYDMIDVENFEMSQRIRELEDAITEYLDEYHEHYRLKYARSWQQRSIGKLEWVVSKARPHTPNPNATQQALGGEG